MAKYKADQKVVFKRISTLNLPHMNLPLDDEVVTIHSYYGLIAGFPCYYVKHYLKSFANNPQVINEKALHPLQFDSASAEIILKFPVTEEKADIKVKEVELA